MPGREVPDLVLLLQPTNHEHGLHVYGVGFDGGKIISKRLLTLDNYIIYGSGFAVSGTKLFRVGSIIQKSPRDVKIWDLSDWRNRNENDFPVECGQTLAPKPCAVVFEFDGKIYALAGMNFPLDHKPSQAFEVFDPTTSSWGRLSDPPFIAEPIDGYSPFIESHTVIGNTLIVALSRYGPGLLLYPIKYYAYNIHTDTWDTVTDDIDNVFHSRAKNFIKHCGLLQNVNHVDENMMVFTCNSRMEVYACDLNSDLDELTTLPPSKKSKFSEDCDCFAERCFPPEIDLSDAFFRVHGFGAKDFPEWFSNHRMVVHLTGDIYCLVYLYLQSQQDKDQMIRVTMFQALKKSKEEQVIEAKILDSSTFKSDLIMIPQAWCTFKSKV